MKHAKVDIDKMIADCEKTLNVAIKQVEEMEKLYHVLDCQCDLCGKETRPGEGITRQTITRGYIAVEGARGPILVEQPLAEFARLEIGNAIHKWCRSYMREKGGTYVKALEFCFEQNPELKEAYARTVE